MDIDIYQQCPCHSDKKIKFCCGKEIVGDLNNVLAKNAAGQPVAALDLLDRTIKKTGPKDCLLTIQTHILIANGEIEKAKESNELFLKNCPGHSTGFHHRALIFLAEGKIDEAVEALQDAMDAITGNEIPISLANAFRMLGVGLFSEGNTIAARAHLTYALALKGDADEELTRMLHESLVSPSVPLVLKQDFPLGPPPADVEWEKKYVNVIRAMDRGQFRKGLKFLRKIDDNFPDQPVVLRAIAVVMGYLGQVDEMVKAFRRYSCLDGVSIPEAVEAEAIAQLFDKEPLSEPVPIERVTFEISETDGVSELALSHPRLATAGTVEVDPFEEGPAPRFAFLVLERDKVSSPDELTLENVPQVIAEILIYGKQTDRSARMEAVTSKDTRYETVKQLVSDTFGEFLQGEPSAQEVGQSNVMSELLEWRWHLPEGVSRERHSELVNANRENLLLNQWPKLEFNVLEKRSPEDAANDPALEIPLRALIMMLETASQGQHFNDELGGKLRQKLGLSEFEPIVPSEKQHVSSPILQQYLDFEKLTDDQLIQIQSDAMQVGNLRVLKKVVKESLRRPDFKGVPRDMSYSMMAHFSDNDEEALEFLGKARGAAEKAGRPVGIYYVQEFELRLSRGMTEGLPELLQTIQMNHLDDPEVEYQLVRVLDRFGIGPDRGPIRGTAPGQPPAPAEGGIWTPGQSESAPAAAQPSPAEAAEPESKPSGLWIPD